MSSNSSKSRQKEKWERHKEEMQLDAEKIIINFFKNSLFFDCSNIEESSLKNKIAKDNSIKLSTYLYIDSLITIFSKNFPDEIKRFNKRWVNCSSYLINEEESVKNKLIDITKENKGNEKINKKEEYHSAMADKKILSEKETRQEKNTIVNSAIENKTDNIELGKDLPLIVKKDSDAGKTLDLPTPRCTTESLPKEKQREYQEPKPEFTLANCKVGSEYSEKIVGRDALSVKEIKIIDIKFPEGLGLTFNCESQIVSGTPAIPGDFDLSLQWHFEGDSTKRSGTCKLTSNPDPKTLWKVIDPSDSLPYQKSHTDKKLIDKTNYRVAAASRRGRSHEHNGSFRDDDFFIENVPNTDWNILIVADGAGSAKNSREGSRIATETAGKALIEKISHELGSEISQELQTWDEQSSQKSIGDKFYYCFYDIAKKAIQAIENEANNKNSSAKEYSTTLLIAVVKKEADSIFLATFWMGDGAIAAYNPNGAIKLMGIPDSGEFAGQTRFLDRNALADKDFGKRIKVGRFSDISSVILMTDGVSDPYFETDNELNEQVKWDALWKDLSPHLESNPDENLVEWLHFFKPGHHDDRTIALLW